MEEGTFHFSEILAFLSGRSISQSKENGDDVINVGMGVEDTIMGWMVGAGKIIHVDPSDIKPGFPPPAKKLCRDLILETYPQFKNIDYTTLDRELSKVSDAEDEASGWKQ